VLVVDDCGAARMLMAEAFGDAGFHVIEAASGDAAWGLFRERAIDLVVSDVRMPGGDGIEFLRRVRDVSKVPVILVTSFADVPTAVTAIRAGAEEYLSFPNELDQLVPRALELLAARNATARPEARIAGRSDAMREVRSRVRGLHELDVPVLVVGECGSGRDWVVETLHDHGRAAGTPLARIVPHASERPLRAGEAVYLDGVDRFTPAAQRLWLEQIGCKEATAAPPSPRVYASSALPLDALATRGRFDRDLANRIGRFAIRLPPLRERMEDLDDLVPALLERRGRELGRDGLHATPMAIARLAREPWPGNVRELDSVVTRLAAFAASRTIDVAHVEGVLAERADAVAALRSQRETEQREDLRELLRECGGNFAEVARRLDLTRGAVVYRAKRFGLFHGRTTHV
jgi:DNA-binding NtrC family response regulator